MKIGIWDGSKFHHGISIKLNKEEKKIYDKEYCKRPEVKARRKQYYYENLQKFKPKSFRDLRKYQKNAIVTLPNEPTFNFKLA